MIGVGFVAAFCDKMLARHSQKFRRQEFVKSQFNVQSILIIRTVKQFRTVFLIYTVFTLWWLVSIFMRGQLFVDRPTNFLLRHEVLLVCIIL